VIKPGKEIYQLLLNKYGLLANESLFIDDSLKNIETANELGFSTIHINGIQSLKEQLISMGLI
jgi:HAD superfamily hydrolase (TIGR01509 family)